ncbi:MAG TPA: hypothetical protein VD926_11115 [Acidimicrobiales bacterium]|nr:hypothetical protein [Acidimicrobiales bacterium]
MDAQGDLADDERGHVETTVADPLAPRPAVDRLDRHDRRGWADWGPLAGLAVSAAVLLAVVVQADVGAIADEGWRDDATWMTAIGMGLIGLALAAVSLATGPDRTSGVLPRVATLVAVLGAFGAVVVVGLADQRGGEQPEAAPVADAGPTAAGAPDDAQGGAPIGLDSAFDPATLTEAAAPILARTPVSVDLNAVGRQLIAREMGCRPRDLVGTSVAGAAIGGTWAEPLVVLNVPVRADGALISACSRVMVRLPVQAGIARTFS